MIRLFIAALICGLLSAPAAAGEWHIDNADSHIAFHGSMLGVPVVGYFRQFTGKITFDPDDLENARVSIHVDMASVDSAHDERDTALALPEWFSAMAFPEARFEAAEFRRLGDAGYEALGSLTIKGITREITLPFELVIEGDSATVSGQVDLNRRDFNIGEGDWTSDKLVAFAVRVEFSVVAQTFNSR